MSVRLYRKMVKTMRQQGKAIPFNRSAYRSDIFIYYWGASGIGSASVTPVDPGAVDLHHSMNPVDYIESCASIAYGLSYAQGGRIPYTIIRELVENFLHARGGSSSVFIGPGGNGMAFIDTGHGLPDGVDPYTSRTSCADIDIEPFIRGPGTGFQIVRDWAREDDRLFWYDASRKKRVRRLHRNRLRREGILQPDLCRLSRLRRTR